MKKAIILIFLFYQTTLSQNLIPVSSTNVLSYTGMNASDIPKAFDGLGAPNIFYFQQDPCGLCYVTSTITLDLLQTYNLSRIDILGSAPSPANPTGTNLLPLDLVIESAPTPLGPWISNSATRSQGSPYVVTPNTYVDWSFILNPNKAMRYLRLTVPARGRANGTVIANFATEIKLYSNILINSSNSSPLVDGNCTTLTSQIGGESYLWSPGGETTQSITVCNSGTYTCQVTNTSFTGNQDHIASIAVSTLGVQDNWVGPNGEVYTIHRNGNSVFYGGDFDAVGPITGSSSPISESTGAPNTSHARVYGTVNATISDGAGGWYIGGTFSRVGNYTSVSNLAHINADGSVDTGFNPVPNGPVYTLTLSGSNLYIGGAFTTVKGLANNYLAKINKTTGTPLFWNANCNNTVRSMLLYSNQIILGGDFTSIGGASRNFLGAVDTTFVQATAWTPNPNAAVYKVFVNGTKLYVGGDFTTISAVAKSRGAGYTLPGFTLDGYDFGANGRIHDFAFYNNVLYAAGNFTIIGGATRNYLAGLNYLNMLANGFNATADAVVQSVGVLNGNLIVGGDFSNIGGAARNRLASLAVVTGLANTWNPNVIGLKGTSYNVLSTAFYGTNIFAGGTFWSVGPSTRNNIAAVDATTGNLLPFNPNANGIVRTVTSDGTNVYFGGDFTLVNGSVIKNRIAQVNATTGAATGWNPNADASVNTLAISGTTLFVGGAFANIGGAARAKIASLTIATGGATAFNPTANGNVNALAISGDTLVVGGAFTTISGQTRNRLALYAIASSTLLATDPNANNTVNALAIKGNKLYVGGLFTTLAATSRNSLAEYNLSSNVVTTFNSNVATSTGVNAVATADSSLYLGGGFQFANNGQPINNAGAVKTLSSLLGYWMPQPDDIIRTIHIGSDKAYVGGRFKVIQSRYQPFFATTDLFNSGNAPLISNVSPLNSCVNSTITINGSGFSGITAVKIGTMNVPFSVVSTSQITIVPNTPVSGAVTITNSLGNAVGLQTLTINALPTVNAGVDQTVCAGASITLLGSGATTYSWNNSISNGVSFIPVSTTTYTVTGTNSTTGCANTDQVLVTVNALPTANAGADFTKTCTQNPTGLIIGAASVSGLTYNWSPATGLSSSTVSNPTANPTATTTYTVTATNTASGCTATDQVLVTVNTTVPVANAGLDFTKTCVQNPNGTTIGVASVAGVTYSWTPATGLSSSTVSNPTANPTATTTYTVTATNTASGCTATDQVLVTVNTTVPVANAGLDFIKTCVQNPNGTTIGVASVAGVTYSWTPATGLSSSTVSNPTANPTATTTYTVTATNTASGCTATDQVLVTVNTAVPVADAGLDFTKTCVQNPNGTTLGAASVAGVTYSWSPATGLSSSTVSNPTANPTVTTTYTVTATNTASGCTATDQVLVTVNTAIPVADAGLDFTKTCVQNPNGTTLGAASVAGVTYSWSPATGLSSSTVSNPTANPTVTTTYTVSAINTASGCTATDQVLVTVNTAVPVADAGLDFTKTCVQNPNGTTLGAASVAGVTYSWSPATGLSSSTVSNPTANPTVTTTYTVTATNTASGCTATDQVLVTVNTAIPVADAGLDFTKTCVQNPNGTTIGVASVAGVTYSWTPATGLSSSTVSNPTANPTATTTYTVTATNTASGCTATDQVLVTVNTTVPVANAGADQSICSGELVILVSSGNAIFIWDNNVNNGVAFAPISNDTYTLTATDVNSGCSSVDQVQVTVNALPTVNAGVDQTVCAGTSVILSGTGATTYSWNNGINNGVSFTPASTVLYSVSGTDINGCVNTDQVQVTVNALPTVNAGIDQSLCVGAQATLTAGGADAYSWDNGVTNDVAFTPTTTTTYTVTGTDANGCVNSDVVTVTVNVLPNVGAGADQSICNGAAVILSGTGANTYTWDNNVLNGVAFNPTATATYAVSGTDANGCENTDQVLVTVNEASESTLTESAMDSFTLNGQTYAQSGTYTQVLSNAAGCDSTITLNLTLSFTGLDELTQSIRVFPNPTTDVLHIESSSALKGEYILFDAAGRKVLEGGLTGSMTLISLNGYAPGMYTVQLNNHSIPLRIIKQ